MAATRKPRPRKLKFELTRSAVAGVGVIVFCLFLWMFLLGVWTGQSLLLPAYKKKVAREGVHTETAAPPQTIRAEKKPVKKSD